MTDSLEMPGFLPGTGPPRAEPWGHGGTFDRDRSGANAIHGVVIIGAIIVMGKAASDNYLALILGFLAVVLGTLNVVGGFVVTDRMLEMFKSKKKKS